jgi:hypothetical protein
LPGRSCWLLLSFAVCFLQVSRSISWSLGLVKRYFSDFLVCFRS